MKNTFKEYHLFSPKEFQKLWKECLFVFDANALLNMYRYSRETVKAYFKVLNELQKKEQLWIPYQVGVEFYENRLGVISEYEKSYDEIMQILNKAKGELDKKYKDHPFLDLSKIKDNFDKGVENAEDEIKKVKEKHPEWTKKDEVLDELNKVFEGNVGGGYDQKKLEEVCKDGEARYEKNIPPGFRDRKKEGEKKYGDLILWYQIIDKAIECKKPIVFISGDVKDDWWVEKDGKRLWPLPQLKKEMYEKAGVDFHIYTADSFLEYYKKDKKEITPKTITEVRSVRKIEEEKMLRQREGAYKNRHGLLPNEKEYFLKKYLRWFKELEYVLAQEDLAAISPNMRRLGNELLFKAENVLSYMHRESFSKRRLKDLLHELSFMMHRLIRVEAVPQRLMSYLVNLIRSLHDFEDEE